MKDTIRVAISKALQELGLTQVAFSVEHPGDLEHGDYAVNVAMVLAKAVGKNPRELAEEIKNKLSGLEHIQRIEIAGPGFINIYLARDFFSKQIEQIHTHPDSWGHNDRLKGKKILIEKSAPNLYKPFHVGHLLNISIGESLSRITRANGAAVTDVAYPSDISLGVAKAVWSLIKTGGDPKDIKALGAAYVHGTKVYEEDERTREEIIAINKELNAAMPGGVWDMYEKGRETSLRYFREITSRLRADFSDTFFESEAGKIGKEIIVQHVGKVFSESDGAIIFRGEEYGLHTRVFVTSLGLPVYEAKDIGLIKLKFEKYDPDLSVVITDVEQKQYFEVIRKVAELVFGEWGTKSFYWQHGRLRFADGKVSSRLGNVPLAEDFLNEVKQVALEKIWESHKDITEENTEQLAEEIAQGAIRYVFLRAAPGQNITFDFNQALSFEGDSGPYLMYTHARICSVLEKAIEKGIVASTVYAPQHPYEIERILYHFSEVIAHAEVERAPHHVVTYLTMLAGAFNTFYAHEKIADETDQYAPYKLALAAAVKATLKNGLWVLGISAPERM